MNMMQLLGLMGTIVLIHVGLGVLAEIGEKKEKERKQCGHNHDVDGDPECHCGENCKCKNNDEE